MWWDGDSEAQDLPSTAPAQRTSFSDVAAEASSGMWSFIRTRQASNPGELTQASQGKSRAVVFYPEPLQRTVSTQICGINRLLSDDCFQRVQLHVLADGRKLSSLDHGPAAPVAS